MITLFNAEQNLYAFVQENKGGQLADSPNSLKKKKHVGPSKGTVLDLPYCFSLLKITQSWTTCVISIVSSKN